MLHPVRRGPPIFIEPQRGIRTFAEPESKQESTVRNGYAEGLLVVGFWSAFMLISRLGLAGENPVTAWDMLALRLATGLLVLAPFSLGLGREIWMSWRMWALAASGGLAYGILVYWGFRLAPATHGAVLFPGLLPFGTAMFGWWLLGKRPAGMQWCGYGLMAGAIAVMAWRVMEGGAVLAGDMLLVGSSVVWAFYGVLAKRWGVHPWVLTRFVALAPALVYLPFYVLFAPKNIAAASTGWLAGQGIYHGVVTTVVVMWLYLRAQDKLGPARLGALMALVPAVSGTAAALVLGEAMTPALAASLGAVSLGAWLAAKHQNVKEMPYALRQHQNNPGRSHA